jgi:hypothetical protein
MCRCSSPPTPSSSTMFAYGSRSASVSGRATLVTQIVREHQLCLAGELRACLLPPVTAMNAPRPAS